MKKDDVSEDIEYIISTYQVLYWSCDPAGSKDKRKAGCPD